MLFSFILPAYKARYLHEAIESILNQTYHDFELVIVDDASPENLKEIVDKFDDDRIRFYRNAVNVGGKNLVRQWNCCISYAKGDYVILASDDDIYSPEYLETFLLLIKKYPEVNVFRPRIQKIDANGRITDIDAHLTEYMSDLEYIYYYSRGFLFSGIPQYIFKISALKEIGGFVDLPAAWFSDDLTVLSLIGNGIVSSPRILFSFRISDINISAKRNDWDLLKKKIGASNQYCLKAEKLLKSRSLAQYTSLEKFYYTSSLGSAKYKARGIVADILYKEGLVAFFKAAFYLRKINAVFATTSWVIKTFCGVCYYKFLR